MKNTLNQDVADFWQKKCPALITAGKIRNSLNWIKQWTFTDILIVCIDERGIILDTFFDKIKHFLEIVVCIVNVGNQPGHVTRHTRRIPSLVTSQTLITYTIDYNLQCPLTVQPSKEPMYRSRSMSSQLNRPYFVFIYKEFSIFINTNLKVIIMSFFRDHEIPTNKL